MIIFHSVDTPRENAPAEATFLKSDPDTIFAAHYKQSVNRDTQRLSHKAEEQRDDQKLK